MCEYFSGSDLLNGMMFHFQYPYTGLEDIAFDRAERVKTAEKMIELKKQYPKLLNSVSYLKTAGKYKKCFSVFHCCL